MVKTHVFEKPTQTVPDRVCVQQQPSIEKFVHSVVDVAEAQLGLWSLKTIRIIMMAGFGLIGLVLMCIVAIYGLFLLDQTIVIGLSRLDMPNWFSPLIRGLVYVGVPAAGLCLLWHTLVGSSATDDSKISVQ